MSTRQATATSGLDRLRGRTVVFSGKFQYGHEDQLRAMAEAQGATVAEDLDKSSDYLVLPELATGKTIQKKAMSLIAKGATIQVIDAADFRKLVEPTQEELVALLRRGSKFANLFNKILVDHAPFHGRHKFELSGENFDGVDLAGFNTYVIKFDGCSFRGVTLGSTNFSVTDNCDFSDAHASGHANLGQSRRSVFRQAQFQRMTFSNAIDHADFTAANLEGAAFHNYGAWSPTGGRVSSTQAGVIFRDARLKGARFNDVALDAPDFRGADLTEASMSGCKTKDANFAKAILRDAALLNSRFVNADFSGADLRGANLMNCDLTNAKFDGANLTGANLRGAQLIGADFSKATGFDPNATAVATLGPSMTELDNVGKAAKRIQFSFRVRRSGETTGDGEEIGVDTNGLKYGWGVTAPASMPGGIHRGLGTGSDISDGLQLLANLLPNRNVRFETVEVQSTKSPKGGKELRELVMSAISEAFGQAMPTESDLAAATKEFREQQREQSSADRERREAAKKLAEREKETQKKQIAKQIAKEVGKVTDIATFLKALELRADKEKIKKATKMLKAEKFQLFNDVTDEHMAGVVKSQTDPDLVYACRIESDGHYACCTQNLNICGGLRGSPCKHLLVLIIGLVKAGKLDPGTIDGWVAKTHDVKPELDKEVMGEIFIRYKGAEAGEVDWRPTETVPEDYYAL